MLGIRCKAVETEVNRIHARKGVQLFSARPLVCVCVLVHVWKGMYVQVCMHA